MAFSLKETQPSPELIPTPLATPEVQAVPEYEKAPEPQQEVETAPIQSAAEPAVAIAAAPVAVAAAAPVKDDLDRAIDKIMEEDLSEAYKALPDDAKLKFRTKGETTASELRVLIQSAKATAKKIFQLLKEWLKLLPGVSHFFLEQVTKIKADKLLDLAALAKHAVI